jgi:hypothetical protein
MEDEKKRIWKYVYFTVITVTIAGRIEENHVCMSEQSVRAKIMQSVNGNKTKQKRKAEMCLYSTYSACCSSASTCLSAMQDSPLVCPRCKTPHNTRISIVFFTNYTALYQARDTSYITVSVISDRRYNANCESWGRWRHLRDLSLHEMIILCHLGNERMLLVVHNQYQAGVRTQRDTRRSYFNQGQWYKSMCFVWISCC